MAKGYKYHAWATEDGRIPVWSVMPLNVSEKTVAGEMLRYGRASGIVLADSNYDAGWLYDAVENDAIVVAVLRVSAEVLASFRCDVVEQLEFDAALCGFDD